MKRRQFTQLFALLGGSLVLPAFARDHSALNMMRVEFDKDSLSRDFFDASVGRIFHIVDDETCTLVLKQTENACGRHCREQFHATFEVSSGKKLNGGIFQLRRENQGPFDLFLTESAHGSDQQQLIATINRQTHV